MPGTETPKEPGTTDKPPPIFPTEEEPKKSDPTKPQPPAKEPAPAAEKPKEEKPKAEKPKTEKPKEEKPKTEKPKPAKPAKKPFEDFPASVAVPQPADAQPATLGKIYVPENEFCFVKLRGGARAMRGDLVFDVRNADDGRAARDWELTVGKADADEQTVLAKLKLNQQSELVLQWEASAKDNAVAPYLRNCVLALTCGGENHFVPLRQPEKAEALTIDLEKAGASPKAEWKVAELPDLSSVKITIEGLQGAKFHVEPSPTFDAEKGKVDVKLEDGGGLLTLHLETSLKRTGLQVTVVPFVKFGETSKPERLNRRQLEQYKQRLEGEIQRLQAGLTQAKQMPKGKADDPRTRQMNAMLQTAESELKIRETTLEQMTKFEETLKAVGGNLKVNFRVFFNADGTEVNLLAAGS